MSVDIPKYETDILRFWNEKKIFQKQLAQTHSQDSYVFFDGPPFATGTPHHGHLTASTIKDVVGRYWSMRGKHVPRNWGWDCHGLPIEGEIIKKHAKTPETLVSELGVAGYNAECRSIVDRYTSEWKATIDRLGRWVDFDNCYRTMDASYMESVWWAFKQLWDKGLVYQGTKVMPFSTALGTPLSNFEAGSNYQDVQDPAIAVLFEKSFDLHDLPCWPTYFVAWTTTPWTLPSNQALAVNPEINYVEIVVPLSQLKQEPVTDLPFMSNMEYVALIIAEDCLESFPEAAMDIDGKPFYNVVERYKGSELVGQRYRDLSMTGSLTKKGLWPTEGDTGEACFTVLAANFVRTDTGTGIVHLAPAFGEDDYSACIQADIKPFCPVDEQGCFTQQVHIYEGLHVKEADKQIIADLKNQGRVLQHRTINHSYPHCPRTDTPLIYKLVPCWYIAVEKIKDKLLETNAQTSWVPSHIKEGRFGKWLENAQDWCVSRNRVWGTPIPIWQNDVTGKTICVGSRQNLMVIAGVSPPFGKTPAETIPDLHRENIDNFEFSLPDEEGVYRRIPEIFDCWFESGAMPYAQNHYPFSGKELALPADFIAEGQDQTRGWFYTLMVLSTALYDKPAFKNVIVNGIVLAEDGRKMAKRLKNYTDPNILLDKYGADPLRLYLLNSGLVKSENLKFTDKDIEDCIKNLLLPWQNVVNFFKSYAEIDGWEASLSSNEFTNPLDHWIVAECNKLILSVNRELSEYRLYEIVPKVVEFFDRFTNTYIRLNRRRFWAEGLGLDKQLGYSAFYYVLENLNRLLAPIIPFTAEHLYKELSLFASVSLESVHLENFPSIVIEPDESSLTPVRLMQEVILLGRKKREQERIEVKTPLRKIKIVHKDPAILAALQGLESFIKNELNVKQVSYSQNEEEYVKIVAKPNFKRLGKRLGSRLKKFKPLISQLSSTALVSLKEVGYLIVCEETFTEEDILVNRQPLSGTDAQSNQFITVILDCKLSPALIREGKARKFVSQIQNLRKEKGLQLADRISLTYDASGEVSLAIEAHKPYIASEVLASSVKRGKGEGWAVLEVDEEKVCVEITKQ